jgi:hypothetical protein
LLATVVGQDLDEGADGVFRIARRVAKDRVISTVDTQARHGHKNSSQTHCHQRGLRDDDHPLNLSQPAAAIRPAPQAPVQHRPPS